VSYAETTNERLFFAEAWRAVREAERCLGCYDAPCAAACPTRINVPRFIGRLRTGNLAGAYETLVSANALPAICGLVCPTEYLCEGACVVSKLSGRPVQIGALQYFVCHAAQTGETAAAERAERVAVIGGGPAGIAAAVSLRRLGYGVSLYDRNPRLGGLVSYAIPSYRLPDSAIERELGRLADAGIALHLGATLGEAELADIFASHAATFLAVGLSLSGALQIPGLGLSGVWPALEYLAAARRAARGEGQPPALGRRVIVIGGGNVAVDAASVAARQGAAQVTVLYRRTQAEMPAWAEEYKDAAALGVQFRWLTAVTEIIGAGGRVSGVRLQRMELTQPDASGRRGVRPAAGDEEILPCDTVIVAIGQMLECDALQRLGLEVTPEGFLRVDAATWETTRRNVFAGGDAVRGGSYVVQAVADGAQAALAIHRRLAGEVQP
jgi:dihydropyrimidine dehydrogenase (NAD+) subunit PreT